VDILAIAAHPDDIEISAGGTLLKYIDSGHSVKLCVVTSGNIGHYNYTKEELAAIRRAEQQESADMMGAEVIFLDFDERIIDGHDERNAIINAIRWADPDVIFTHDPTDNSLDHNVVGNIVSHALLCLKWKNQKTEYPPISKLPAVFFWETAGGLNFQPQQYVDITDYMEKKRELLSCHKSQVELEQDYKRLIEVSSAYRGMQSGYRYAEGFRAHMSFENPPNYKLLP